jgi:transcriptional regulator with XRE-family HTH domain
MEGSEPTRRRIQAALRAYGADVRRRRLQLDMTQSQAARRAGISQSHWSKVERALHEPSIGQMLRIQYALGADSLETFLGQQPSARWLNVDPATDGESSTVRR